MEKEKNNMNNEKNNSVSFEDPIKDKDQKKGMSSKTKKIVAVVAGIAAAAGAGYCGYRIGKNRGWKDGYNTGSSVTTIIERTPDKDLETVGQEIGVNARAHKECSDRVWQKWVNRPRKTSW